MPLYIVLVPIDDVLLVGSSVTVTKLLGLAVAAAAIVTILKRRHRLRVQHAVVGWAAVVALMLLSTVWGIDPAWAKLTVVPVVSAFALFVVVVAVPMEPSEFRAVIAATILSGAIVGLISLVSAQHELSTIKGQVGRLYLSFGTATEDPNRFGASLLLPVAMTVGAIGQARGWSRIGLLAILPLPLAAIYLTASRGTTLALIAMAIVGILASRHRLALSAFLGRSRRSRARYPQRNHDALFRRRVPDQRCGAALISGRLPVESFAIIGCWVPAQGPSPQRTIAIFLRPTRRNYWRRGVSRRIVY